MTVAAFGDQYLNSQVLTTHLLPFSTLFILTTCGASGIRASLVCVLVKRLNGVMREVDV